MTDKNETRQEPQNNFFDQLMFGPPRQPVKEQQPLEEEKAKTKPSTEKNNATNNNNVTNNETNPAPEVDIAQMMQQFDTMMNYANKIGPSLKKLTPLFDILKQFSGPKK